MGAENSPRSCDRGGIQHGDEHTVREIAHVGPAVCHSDLSSAESHPRYVLEIITYTHI